MAEMNEGASYLLKLNQSLEHLGGTVEKLNKTVKINTKAALQVHKDDKQDKTLKALTRVTGMFSNGMGSILSKQRINYELSRMSPVNASLFRAIAGAINQQMDYQRIANGFGRGVRDVVGRQGRQMVRGTGGFSEQLTTQMNLAQAGMRGSMMTQSVRNLATGMRLTGQNEQKLIGALRQTATVGGTTNEGLSILSETLHRTSKEYGVTTDLLLEGMADQRQLQDNNLLGITESLDRAVTELGGKYGGRADMIRGLAQAALDPDNIQFMAVAGLDNIGRRMADSNTTAEEQVMLLEKLINELGPMAKNQARLSADPRRGLELQKAMYGDLGAIAASLHSTGGSNKAAVELQKEFNNNFDVFGRELLSDVEKFSFQVFGQYQGEIVNTLKSMEGLLKVGIGIGAGTAVIRGTSLLSSAGKAGRNAGWNNVIRAMIGLPPMFGDQMAGESDGIAGTKRGPRATGQLAKGATGLRTAGTAGGGGLASLLPWIGLGATVVGGAIGLAAYFEHKEKELDNAIDSQLERTQKAIDERRNSATAIGLNSNLSRASGSTPYEIVSINTQREQNRMLQEMIKELKRGNSKDAPITVNTRGL